MYFKLSYETCRYLYRKVGLSIFQISAIYQLDPYEVMDMLINYELYQKAVY